jgi:hypothetical protein
MEGALEFASVKDIDDVLDTARATAGFQSFGPVERVLAAADKRLYSHARIGQDIQRFVASNQSRAADFNYQWDRAPRTYQRMLLQLWPRILLSFPASSSHQHLSSLTDDDIANEVQLIYTAFSTKKLNWPPIAPILMQYVLRLSQHEQLGLKKPQ